MTPLCNEHFCIADPFVAAILLSILAVICAYGLGWWVSEGIDEWRAHRSRKLNGGERT